MSSDYYLDWTQILIYNWVDCYPSSIDYTHPSAISEIWTIALSCDNVGQWSRRIMVFLLPISQLRHSGIYCIFDRGKLNFATHDIRSSASTTHQIYDLRFCYGIQYCIYIFNALRVLLSPNIYFYFNLFLSTTAGNSYQKKREYSSTANWWKNFCNSLNWIVLFPAVDM